MISSWTSRVCLLGAVLALLQACSLPQRVPDAESGKPDAGNVIVVGKFEITPPVSEIEKELGRETESMTFGSQTYEVFFSVTNQPVKRVSTNLMSDEWENLLSAFWGKTYFKELERKKTYLNAGVLYTDAKSADRVWLPGGMSFTPPAGAQAVYIGTVRFTRDDFWNITKIQIVDEYKKANAEFRKRFGKTVALKKSLLH